MNKEIVALGRQGHLHSVIYDIHSLTMKIFLFVPIP